MSFSADCLSWLGDMNESWPLTVSTSMQVDSQYPTIFDLDFGYVQIMPSANKAKAVFDSGRTASYNIRSVVACQQSAKSSSTFKLVVHRDGGTKRYDFEAESPKLANEIVQSVKSIRAALERSGTMNKSRRSKNVG